MLLVAVSDPIHVDKMSTPGAKMSRTGPQLEKEALVLLDEIAPTVIALGAEAGL